MTTVNSAARAILFDLDGTLVDTAPDFVCIIERICAKHGLTTPNKTAIREQVSAGARAMVGLLLNRPYDANDPTLAAYLSEFLAAYQDNICTHSRLFSGFEQLLKDLNTQKIPWGIVTNKPRHLSKLLLQRLGLDKRCTVLVCPEDVAQAKPSPEGLLLACQVLGVQAEAVLYIGDHQRDILAGKNAGTMTAVAEFGYIASDENSRHWQADYYCQSPQDLVYLIKRFIEGSSRG